MFFLTRAVIAAWFQKVGQFPKKLASIPHTFLQMGCLGCFADGMSRMFCRWPKLGKVLGARYPLLEC